MASFNDLPIELIIKIINLSVEDIILLNGESSRCSILSNLSLISKQFTLPSQIKLWKFLFSTKMLSESFMNLIKSGFGKEMIVERFTFTIRDETIDIILEILRGLKRVEHLRLGAGFDQSCKGLNKLFEVPSLQQLKSLQTMRANFDDIELKLPSTLTEVRIGAQDLKETESLFVALQSSNAIITILELQAPPFLSSTTESPHAILQFFQLRGSSLVEIDFSSIPSKMVQQLLPFTTGLNKLKLPIERTDTDDITSLKSLPTTARLTHLDVGSVKLGTFPTISYLVDLLELPQLSQLEALYIVTNPFSERLPKLYELGGKMRDGIGKYKREEMDLVVEFCKEKGVRLHFISSTAEAILREQIRQGLFDEEDEEEVESGNGEDVVEELRNYIENVEVK